MIAFGGKVIAYTEGLDQTRFVGSGLNYDATVPNLELIGEVAISTTDWRDTAHLAGGHPFKLFVIDIRRRPPAQCSNHLSADESGDGGNDDCHQYPS